MKNKKILAIPAGVLAIALAATIAANIGGAATPATPAIQYTPAYQAIQEVIQEVIQEEAPPLTLDFSTREPFHTRALSIDITASHPGATIFYTTDGSWPTTESRVFNNTLSFNPRGGTRSEVVRAKAVYNGQVSETITQTYFIGQQINHRFDTLIFSISADPEGLFSHETGIFVPGILREEFVRANPGRNIIPTDPANFNIRGMEGERHAYVEVFDQAGERIFTQAAGIRVHGGWSRAEPQKSIRVIARHMYSPGDGQFHFDFFPWEMASDGSPIFRYDTLILRNGGNDRAHGMLRHEVGSILARNGGFTAVSPVRPVAVFVNGAYYGFAWLQVRFNEQYIENLFNTPTRNIDVVGMGENWFDTDDAQIIADLHYKNSYAHKDLLDDDIFADLNAIVDIENLMFYYAFQIYLGNNDWPHNNMRRWRYTGPELGLTPETDGRWRYIIFDLDQTFGLFGTDYTNPTFYRVIASQNPASPLLRNILTRPDMAAQFIQIMEYIAHEVVTLENVTQVVNYLVATGGNEMQQAITHGLYPSWFNFGFAQYHHQQIIDFANHRPRQIFADMNAFFGN